MGYIFLKNTSLSLSERPEVERFKDYLSRKIVKGKILDVGCGPLDLPGYLDLPKINNYQIYGLDPINNVNFKGFMINGCAEFMPFSDGFFDNIIYATSLDHVCSIEKALQETYRVLSKNGKLILWISDASVPLIKKIKRKIKIIYKSLKEGYRVDRYVIYPNYSVFYIPEGCSDPFHAKFESPKKTIKLIRKFNFELEDYTYNDKNEIFLTFIKSR